MQIKASKVFSVDYTDKDAVIELAKSFGPNQTVFKHPDRTNFNITHTERTDRYKPEWVIFQT